MKLSLKVTALAFLFLIKLFNKPDCEILCPIEKFLKITANKILANYVAECSISPNSK